MKAILTILACILASTLFSQSNIQQTLSVNGSGAAADASAQLDVSATDKGVLVPRMTTPQRTAITAANALLVFDSDTRSFWFFDSPAAAWREIRAGNIATLADADGDTKIQVEESPDEDIIRFDLGGTENMVLQKNAGGHARLELPDASNNTFIGQEAGMNLGANIFDNTFLGYRAGKQNATGNANTFLGSETGRENTAGFYNTASGYAAMVSNTVGNSNAASGSGALFSNTTGSFNVAIGRDALFANFNGEWNTALGGNAAAQNVSGNYNTAIGTSALYFNTGGHRNTATGVQALHYTTGSKNTAQGTNAMFLNTSGSSNTAQGDEALFSNTTGNANIAIGQHTLFSNTTRSNLVAVGDSALYNNGLGASGTQATFNTALGSKALFANTTGEGNTAAGKDALRSNTDGNFNTAHGLSALFSNTSGTFNTASGWNALYFNQGGFANTAFGPNTLGNNTAGSYNAASGDSALGNNSTGSSNTAQGVQALSTNTTGSNNTAIGAQADVTANNLTNATAIGYNAKVGASNSLVLGGTGADAVNVGIGTQTPGHPLHLDAVGTGFAHTAGSVVLTTFADPTYSPAGGWIGTVSNHPLFFFADNPAAPQMTLTQNGDLGIGISTVPAGIRLQVEGNIATPSGNSVYVGGVTNDGDDGLRMHQTAGGSYIDHKGAGDLLFRADNVLGGTPRMTIRNNGNVGIGRNPVTNLLEVEGDASKSSAGDWLANSDARLKKNIQPLNSQLMLQSLLALRGVTYEWNDDQTGSKRPEGIQYGFTAQNIREVFPTLVEEDKLGFLQTAYGTYDAMTVEAIRALHLEIENGEWRIENLVRENAALKVQLEAEKSLNATQSAQLDKIAAALAGAGIAVEK